MRNQRKKKFQPLVPSETPVMAEAREAAEIQRAKVMSLPPEPSLESRLAAVKSAENPLLEAAQPLLRTMCDLPDMRLGPAGVEVLYRLLEREVMVFERICKDARIRHEHIVAASYALCTALDEVINQTPWGGGQDGKAGLWAGKELAQIFHEDRDGGVKVFLLIGRLATSQHEHLDLLDLMFFILSLGFEGRYRSEPDGRRKHDQIRHRLYEIQVAARGEVPTALSPNWKPEEVDRSTEPRIVPVWLTVSVLGSILLVMFSWYKYQLVTQTNELVERIRALGAIPLLPAYEEWLRSNEVPAPELERASGRK